MKYNEGAFDSIDLSSVGKDAKSIMFVDRYQCSDAPSRARQLVEDGDILVATVRPNLNGVALVGKEHDGMTASTGYCVLRPIPEKLDSKFLFHWVKTGVFVQRMVDVATGANYPAVSDSKVKSSTIPLPPLPEQKRIAAILDAADALRAKRHESIAQLDALLQSIFLDMFGDPVRNPKHFPFLQLGEIGNWRSGGTPPRSRPDYFNGNIPWFSSGELNNLYAIRCKEKVTKKAILETSAKAVPPKALILGMYDTAALKASIATEECSCNQAVAFSKIDTAKANILFVTIVQSIETQKTRLRAFLPNPFRPIKESAIAAPGGRVLQKGRTPAPDPSADPATQARRGPGQGRHRRALLPEAGHRRHLRPVHPGPAQGPAGDGQKRSGI